MKTRMLIMLVFVLASIASSKIGAQVILKDGGYFGFAGDYEYKDEKGGTYELFVWGSEGEFEAELSYKSKSTTYKVACTAKYEDGDIHMLFISFNKVTSGTFPQKATMTSGSKKMFTLAMQNDTTKEDLITLVEDLKIAGLANNKPAKNIFKKLESEGDEGPP